MQGVILNCTRRSCGHDLLDAGYVSARQSQYGCYLMASSHLRISIPKSIREQKMVLDVVAIESKYGRTPS